jgi:hypothetical protein
MKLVADLIWEYLLIVKIHVISLGREIPKNWKNGDKGDVILLQGFMETWCFLEKIGNALNAAGYRVHTINEFAYNTKPVNECVNYLEQYIERNNIKKVILASHSKGGIVAKLYMDRKSSYAKVIKSFSIATPYQGTLLGYLHFFSLCEFEPSSDVIQEILANTNNTDKICNIHARIDNHIVPSKNAALPGAVNSEVEITGHTRILEDNRTVEIIKRNLRMLK